LLYATAARNGVAGLLEASEDPDRAYNTGHHWLEH
jgi:hypothetical protein